MPTLRISSGNDCYIAIENGPFMVDDYPLNIVIFHGYVSLREDSLLMFLLKNDRMLVLEVSIHPLSF